MFTSKMSKDRLQFCLSFGAVVCIFPKKQNQTIEANVCCIFYYYSSSPWGRITCLCVWSVCVFHWSLRVLSLMCTHTWMEVRVGYWASSPVTLHFTVLSLSLIWKFKVSVRLRGQRTLDISMSPPQVNAGFVGAQPCLDVCLGAAGSNSLSRRYIASTIRLWAFPQTFNYCFIHAVWVYWKTSSVLDLFSFLEQEVTTVASTTECLCSGKGVDHCVCPELSILADLGLINPLFPRWRNWR